MDNIDLKFACTSSRKLQLAKPEDNGVSHTTMFRIQEFVKHTSLFRIQGCFASRLFFAYSTRLFRIQGFFAHEAVLHVRPLCYKAGLLKSLLSIQGFFASRLFCTRVCLSYKAVSHTTLFRILGCFRLLDVSYTNLFRSRVCFTYEAVPHTRLFRFKAVSHTRFSQAKLFFA